MQILRMGLVAPIASQRKIQIAARFAERQKQIRLAAARGEMHLGRNHREPKTDKLTHAAIDV